jgi:hypothetical protein
LTALARPRWSDLRVNVFGPTILFGVGRSGIRRAQTVKLEDSQHK